MINYGKQDISDDDVNSVVAVLRSDFLTQGPAVPNFEKSVQHYCSVDYALAVNSATSALHIALKALDVSDNDYVWTSPNSFVASANCALYCNANIDFVDIDPDTFNMCTQALEEKLIQASKQGVLPKVVIPVHFAGQPCEMSKIKQLSLEYNFYIVEDASHAIGAKYPTSFVGSCEFSDITVFSFHPVKIITTGEGGMVVTRSTDLFEKLKLYRTHGVTRDESFLSKTDPAPWYYEQLALGFNYRMTDIQAALGCSQMSRLNYFIETRNNIASAYNDALVDLPINLPKVKEKYLSAFHLYVIRLKLEEISPKTHRQVFESLRNRGIGVNVHYIPIHTQPYFKKLGFGWGDFPISENYYERAISIPIYPSLKEHEQVEVVSSIKQVLKT